MCPGKKVGVGANTLNNICEYDVIHLLVIRSGTIKMCKAVHQPGPVDLEHVASEVEHQYRVPPGFPEEVDRHRHGKQHCEYDVQWIVVPDRETEKYYSQCLGKRTAVPL